MSSDYKKTAIGLIPYDWKIDKIRNVALVTTGEKNTQDKIDDGLYPFFVRSDNIEKINSFSFDGEAVLTAGDGVGTGKIFHYINGKFDFHQRVYMIYNFSEKLNGYFFYLYFSFNFYSRIMQMTAKSSVDSIRKNMIADMLIPIPPLYEQKKIVDILKTINDLIHKTNEKITKIKNLKIGFIQTYMNGRKRLPGFTKKWEMKYLDEVLLCLDHLRMPLNNTQRAKMKGEYPYCGANGIVDYIDDYMIDDDIILMAEDGGYFEEYQTRPIAYRMKGKCWVNNHAHILKAKENYSQDFIFYSLVNKNILKHITGGTRSKLNKSELLKIKIYLPIDKTEQIAIASVLNDLTSMIVNMETKMLKIKSIEYGLMQELLDGKTRLIQ